LHLRRLNALKGKNPESSLWRRTQRNQPGIGSASSLPSFLPGSANPGVPPGRPWRRGRRGRRASTGTGRSAPGNGIRS